MKLGEEENEYLTYIVYYGNTIITGGKDRKTCSMDIKTLKLKEENSSKRVNESYCSIVIKNKLIIGCYEQLRILSLPKLE